MGNAVGLDAYWEDALRWSRSVEATEEARITSPTSYHTYVIQERIGQGQIYRAVSGPASYILKIIDCESYTALQALHRLLTEFQRHSEDLRASSIVEFFHTRDDDGSWMMVVVLEHLEGLSLEDWIACVRSHPDPDLCGQLERDVIIPAFRDLLEILHRAEQLDIPLGAITARRLFIRQQPLDAPRAFLRTEDHSYSFVLLSTSQDALLSTKETHKHLLPPETVHLARGTDTWGAGITLYTALLHLMPHEVPAFTSLSPEQRLEQVKRVNDPGLEEILVVVLTEKEQRLSAEEALAHPNLAVWLSFLSAGELQEDLQYTFACLQTGLRFRNKLVRARSLEGMLELECEAELSELYENLHAFRVTRLFLEVASEYPKWEENALLLLNAIKLVNLIIANNSAFVQLIQEQGFLRVALVGMQRAHTFVAPELKSALVEFVTHFLQNNTLTVLQTLYETWEIRSLLFSDDIQKNGPFWQFLRRSMPLYGSQAVKVLQRLYHSRALEANEVLQALVEVPYYFKVTEVNDVTNTLIELVQRLESGRVEAKCTALKALLSNLADLLIAPKWYEFAHVTGVCTNRLYTSELLECLGKHPMLFYCLDCKKAYCCVCLSEHIQHQCQFLGYQKDFYACSTTDVQHMDFAFDFLFTWQGTKIATYLNRASNDKFIDTIHLTDESGLQLITEHPLCFLEDIGDEATAAYFEVYVLQGGTKDGIILGLGANEPVLTFRGTDGAILVNGKRQATGPKFGSYDTIGVGVTSKGNGFVTYNGLLYRPMLPLDLHGNVYAFISLEGTGTLVSPQCWRNNWKFRPDLLSRDIASYLRVTDLEAGLAEKIFRTVERLVRSIEKASRSDQTSVAIGMATEFLKAFRREDLLAGRKEFGGGLSNQLCSASACQQF